MLLSVSKMKNKLQAFSISTLAALLRFILAALGIGDLLATRIEVSHAANGILSMREGITLMQRGVSPYSASACSTSPIILHLFAWLGSSTLVVAMVLTVADLVAGWLLHSVIVRGIHAGKL